jgi:hypothetical protein
MVLMVMVVAALGAIVVGSVWGAVRVLAWVRRNRGATIEAFGVWTVGGWLGQLLDDLNGDGESARSNGDPSALDGLSGHAHHADSSPDGGGMDGGAH